MRYNAIYANKHKGLRYIPPLRTIRHKCPVAALSRRQQGFESPWGRQILAILLRSYTQV